ncbi:MAG: BrnA antitoxin family protein [Treponema sp.]|nr:BrnA antitoxin family protein [Treponema sp.]
MGITKSTVKVGQKPPKEAIQEAKKAARQPVNYTEEAPRSTPEALAEFAALRAAQKKKDVRPVVALRIQPEVLERYKSLGRGYSGIMADVLKLAAEDPEILLRASQAATS